MSHSGLLCLYFPAMNKWFVITWLEYISFPHALILTLIAGMSLAVKATVMVQVSLKHPWLVIWLGCLWQAPKPNQEHLLHDISYILGSPFSAAPEAWNADFELAPKHPPSFTTKSSNQLGRSCRLQSSVLARSFAAKSISWVTTLLCFSTT